VVQASGKHSRLLISVLASGKHSRRPAACGPLRILSRRWTRGA